MALLPTIPTSFVPRTASAVQSSHIRTEFGGALAFFSYAVLAIVFLLALGVFFYGRILAAEIATKNSVLAKAEAAIDEVTVQGFVKLRDRLSSSQTLLNNHLAFSGFFSALGSIVPGTLRFSGLHLTIDSTGIVKVDGSGVSRSFNSLAVASKAFADDGRIKNVIFSKIRIEQGGFVSFGFSATLSPELVAYSVGSSEQATDPTSL